MDPARVDTTVYSIIRSVELDVSTAGADQVQQQVRGAAFTARVQAFPIGPLGKHEWSICDLGSDSSRDMFGLILGFAFKL